MISLSTSVTVISKSQLRKQGQCKEPICPLTTVSNYGLYLNRAVGSSNITKVDLSGVGAAHAKHVGDGTEPKGVKAHFSMDDSGIFSLSLVESIFEKNSTEAEGDDASDTLSKIGSAFSSLFGMSYLLLTLCSWN